jgi:hypothetical protein
LKGFAGVPVPVPVPVPLDDLIDLLNGRLTDEVQDGTDQLIERGSEVIPLLVQRVGELAVFGRLAAIEVFEVLHDSRACPALEALLLDDSHTVRRTAADVLGRLGCIDAVPALKRLEQRERAERPASTGCVVVREALTRLGARVAVLPPLTGSLLIERALVGGTHRSPYWPVSRLADVVNDLTDHRQAVIHLRLWPLTENGHVVWVPGPIMECECDRSASWEANLAHAREAALRYAGSIPGIRKPALAGRDLVVEVVWIDESDVL